MQYSNYISSLISSSKYSPSELLTRYNLQQHFIKLYCEEQKKHNKNNNKKYIMGPTVYCVATTLYNQCYSKIDNKYYINMLRKYNYADTVDDIINDSTITDKKKELFFKLIDINTIANNISDYNCNNHNI